MTGFWKSYPQLILLNRINQFNRHQVDYNFIHIKCKNANAVHLSLQIPRKKRDKQRTIVTTIKTNSIIRLSYPSWPGCIYILWWSKVITVIAVWVWAYISLIS